MQEVLNLEAKDNETSVQKGFSVYSGVEDQETL